VLDGGGGRVVGVDLHEVAEAVELVGLAAQVEAGVEALPLAVGLALGGAEAGDGGAGPLVGDGVGVAEVDVEVLLAGQHGAPRGQAPGAVVEGARHAGAGWVGGGLDVVGAGAWADEAELGGAGDTAVERPELAGKLTGALGRGDLEDGVAVVGDADADLLLGGVVGVVVREHLRLGGVLV